MIIRLGEVELLQFSVRVAAIDVDTRIGRHKRDRLVQDSHSLMEASLPKEAGAHVVVGEADLNSYVVLQSLDEHELACALEIRQSLVVVFALAVDGGSKQKEPCHVVEEVQALGDVFHCHEPITFENKLGGFFVVLHGAGPLNC